MLKGVDFKPGELLFTYGKISLVQSYLWRVCRLRGVAMNIHEEAHKGTYLYVLWVWSTHCTPRVINYVKTAAYVYGILLLSLMVLYYDYYVTFIWPRNARCTACNLEFFRLEVDFRVNFISKCLFFMSMLIIPCCHGIMNTSKIPELFQQQLSYITNEPRKNCEPFSKKF